MDKTKEIQNQIDGVNNKISVEMKKEDANQEVIDSLMIAKNSLIREKRLMREAQFNSLKEANGWDDNQLKLYKSTNELSVEEFNSLLKINVLEETIKTVETNQVASEQQPTGVKLPSQELSKKVEEENQKPLSWEEKLMNKYGK